LRLSESKAAGSDRVAAYREAVTARLLTALAAGIAVAAPAFASGGYFPSEWGLLLLGCALLLFALAASSQRPALGPLDAVLLGALGALVGWQLLSIGWSPGPDAPVLEAERTLVYLAASAVVLLAVPRERVLALLGGLVAGTVVIAVAGLGDQLLRGPAIAPSGRIADVRLGEPIGYPNAVGILVCLGGLVAAALALRTSPASRAAASAALVPLGATLALTLSRGPVVALAVGVVALLVLESERGRALGALLVLSLAPALAVLLSLRSPLADAATTRGQTDSAGHALVWQLALLTVAAAGAGVIATRVGRALAPYAVAIASLALVAVVALLLVVGPRTQADRTLNRFRADPTVTGSDVPGRLLSISSGARTAYWGVAWQMIEREPLVGEGAGSYERWWLQLRPVASYVRDAHNLYLETLAELGPPGLVLLLTALGVPLAATRAHARHPAVPAAGAAYVAFLVHAGLDWDWEIPSVTLTGLACGASLVVLGRPQAAILPWSRAARAAGLAVACAVIAVALVAHVGNRAAAASEDALAADDLARARAEARRAQRWQPWGAAPSRLLGEAELAGRRDTMAVDHLRDSIRRDSQSWHAWYDLAVVAVGQQQADALRRATALNPLGPEIADLRQELQRSHTDS
jgi:hypothetical protein